LQSKTSFLKQGKNLDKTTKLFQHKINLCPFSFFEIEATKKEEVNCCGKEKEKEEEEVIGKLFGALPIDQLVINPALVGGVFVVKY
jgi:hypothetical protein